MIHLGGGRRRERRTEGERGERERERREKWGKQSRMHGACSCVERGRKRERETNSGRRRGSSFSFM